MADVRALFRELCSAQNKHRPYAAYSPSGKLLCNICHELIKTEASWDDHIQSANHRQQLRISKSEGSSAAGLDQENPIHGDDAMEKQHKRKHNEVDEDNASDNDRGGAEKEDLRKKRTKSQTPGHVAEVTPSEYRANGHSQNRIKSIPIPKSRQKTPPLGHRTSGIPVQGFELQIPSRPATPVTTRDAFLVSNHSVVESGLLSATPTSKNVAADRLVVISQDHTTPRIVEGLPKERSQRNVTTISNNESHSLEDLDEAEWAAFEADVVNAPSSTSMEENAAVTSVGGVNTTELKEPQSKNLAAADARMNDEKEEADRALETEFEDMVELEVRVRKLREKREALRRLIPAGVPAVKTENKSAQIVTSSEQERGASDIDLDGGDVTADDDEDEADDWNGFRFKV